MTPLRQRMIEDMQLRNLSESTQRSYQHYITGLARFYQITPAELSLEEVREYQLHLIDVRRFSAESVNTFVSAANFLYQVTLEAPWPEKALMRGRADDGLRSRAAGERSGVSATGSHRCPAHAVAGAAGEREEGPLLYALAALAGDAALLVAFATPRRPEIPDGTHRLAVSGIP